MPSIESADEVAELIPTRQSLLSRLKDWNDQDSWKDFFDTYWRLIYRAAVKAGLTDAEAQDAVQETVIAVMKKMPEFRYDATKGSFKGWLLKLTRWRVVDQLRKRQKGAQNGRYGSAEHSDVLGEIADPASQLLEEAWEAEWEQNLLKAAMERVKKRVDAKHFQVFDLYACKGWPVSKVAATLEVSSARVYLIKHRVGQMVKKEVDRLRAKHV